MTTLQNAPAGSRVDAHAPGRDDRSAMVRRGVVLLLGALAIVLAIKPIGGLPYYWVPVFTGATFAIAAAVGGRGSPLMGAGLTVLAWGLGKVITSNIDFSWAGAFTTATLGLGALAALAVHRYGFPSTLLTIGFAILFIALGQYIHGEFNQWITAYAGALAAVYGVVELLHAAQRRRESVSS